MLKQMKDREDRRPALAWLLPSSDFGETSRRGKAGDIGLDMRTSRRIIWKASLIMSNLRTKAWENVSWGYMNRPLGGQCE
jgi:hypothetical protein